MLILCEDGRGKVAALLRCQGVNVKGLLKTALAKEELNRTLMLLEICRDEHLVIGNSHMCILPQGFMASCELDVFLNDSNFEWGISVQFWYLSDSVL
ncbi:hypothetical protein OIU77_021123, partial [Salix suchowensis]